VTPPTAWPSTWAARSVKPRSTACEIQNRSDQTKARARVYPVNYQAILDDAKNSTLLKSMMMYPSEPIPATAAAPEDTPWSPGFGPSAEGELGGEVGGIGEAGEAGAAAAAL
jgi:hypothetical protein